MKSASDKQVKNPLGALAYKKIIFGVTIFLFSILQNQIGKAQVDPQDSLALIAIYNSTNGQNWTTTWQWDLSKPVKTWAGITITNNRVTRLLFQGCNLTGVLPPEIGNLTKLESIFIDSNPLSGTIPASIGNLNNLLTILINNTQISGAIPDTISYLSKLIEISLSGNKLSGIIPNSLGNLINLTSLQLSGNQLTGNIPETIYNLSKLQILNLGINQLTGIISPSIGNLKNLTQLLLYQNRLTGPIPESISELTKLTNVSLQYNQFSGIVPSSLGSLTNLQVLYLTNNQITGLPLLPSSMGKYGQIASNLLTFDDIIPNLAHLSIYSPQNTIGTPRTKTINSGTTDTIQLNFDNNITASTYQWYKNGSLLTQTSTNYLTISNASAADAGSYTCNVTNSQVTGLTLTTASITVTIKVCPQITTQPTSLTINSGPPVTFSVIAAGATSYQWRKNGTNIIGANSATYTIANVSTNDAASYDVVVSNANNCSVTSNAATLTVNDCILPFINTQPTNTTTCTSSAYFSLSATGTGLTYQWQVSTDGGVTFNNITTAGVSPYYSNWNMPNLGIYSISTAHNGYMYRCIVTGSCGTPVTSNTTTLTVNPGIPAAPGTISGLSSPCPNVPGITYSIAPVVNATTYTWYVPSGWNITSGAGTTSITVTPGTNSGYIYVSATNSCGTGAYSNSLSVIPSILPSIATQPANTTTCTSSAYFSLSATGTGLTYQWQVSTDGGVTFNNITTAGVSPYYSNWNMPNLGIYSISTAHNGYMYRCIVTGSCGAPVTSNTTTLTVNPGIPAAPGTISGPPSPCPNVSGITYSITPVVNATTYTWYVPSGWDITSGTGTTSITVTPGTNSGYIYVSATNSCGTGVYSNSLSVIPSILPSISTQPTSLTINSGSPATFTAVATDATSYQWRKNGTNIIGATGANYTIPNTTSEDAGSYDVIVSNDNGCSVTSDSATITINQTGDSQNDKFVLAGTSLDGKIFKSIDNGTSFTDEGTAGKGNPNCFCKLSNGDILYGTDQGYVVNYTQGTNVKLSENSITSLASKDSLVFCGDNSGNFYTSSSNGTSYSLSLNVGSSIYSILFDGTHPLLFTYSGILNYLGTNIQPELFMSACDAGNGFIFAGTAWGHIWRNTNSNDFSTWTDLGIISFRTQIPIIIKGYNGRILLAAGGNIYYSDDMFSTTSKVGNLWVYNLANLNNNILLAASNIDGKIYRSVDNGENWSDLGQQFSQSSINCLLNIDETTPSAPSGLSTQTFCAADNPTISNLTAKGTLIKWYESPTGGTALDVTNALINGKIYYASQTVKGIESNDRLAVSVIVTPSPNQPSEFTSSGAMVCQGQSAVLYTVPNDTTVSYNWVYTGTGADIEGSSNSINISFSNTATGGVLSVTANNECGTSDPREISIIVNSSPKITTQPIDQTVCENNSKTFSVRATGTGLIYQWQNSADGGNTWNDITGATANNYTVKAAITMDSYLYRCVVTGSACPSFSNAAKLTVTPAAKITLQPTNQATCEGGSATFTVGASGIALTFQWQAYINNVWTDLTGATNTTYSETAASAAMNGRLYHCVVKGTCGTATSSAARLTVNLNPTITTQPVDQTICENSTNTISVKATGYALAYQWQNSTDGGTTWNNVLNATSANYALKASMAMDGNVYRCMVSGGCGTAVASDAAKVTVIPIARITQQPASQTVCEGNSATFTVAASGTGLTYQWQSYLSGVWTDMTGATNPSCDVIASAALNGRLYRCVVKGTCGSATSTNARLTVNLNPSVTTQPADQTICENSTKTFSVKATGYSLTYQWQNSTDAGSTWNNLAGATAANCAVKATLAMDGYLYHCIVSGGCGTPVTSNAAKVTVTPLAKITLQPVSQIVCEGTTVTFTAGASGNNLTYQWQSYIASVWTDIGGATNTTYSVTSTALLNGRLFRCLAKGTCNTATSNSAKLTVNLAPQITMQPANQAVCDGITASFKITATGAGLSYQWQSYISDTWTNITGAKSSTYNIKATSVLHGRQYRCHVTGTCGTADSNAALLTLGPQITTQPADQIVCENSQATFGSIAAIGIGPFTYQWQQSADGGTTWNNISNAVNATYTVVGVPSINGYRYRCIVNGSCGYAATSNPAQLLVNALPKITTQPVDQTICEDQQVSFGVTATGPQLNYQWSISTDGGNTWNNISGANSTSYTVIADNSMDENRYRCTVGSICTPPATSNTALLKVTPKTEIISQPMGQTICEDNIVTFSISAAGANLTYQWQNSNDGGNTWQNLDGETNSSYKVSTTFAMNGYLFRCAVNGSCGSVTSDVAQLIVTPKAQITEQPTNQVACEGSVVTYHINADGENITYQWQESTDNGSTWNDIVDETDNNYNSSTSVEMNGYQYRCNVNSSCGSSITSSSAQLTVNPLPQITSQPLDIAVCEGSIANFSIEASGSNLTYQWQSFVSNSWEDIADATNPAYSEIATNPINGRFYRCVVNGSCTAYSNIVKLTVHTAPQISVQPVATTACEGSTAAFWVIATGTDSTYQWQQSIDNGNTWNDIEGATNYAYTTTTTSDMNGNLFRCVVGGSCGSPVTSGIAQLNVSTDQKFTAQPADQKVSAGSSATFSVGVTGSNITYQWQNDIQGYWANIDGASNETYQVTADVTTEGSYRCVISGTCNSNEAELTLARMPVMVSQPVNQISCEGSMAVFSLNATGYNLMYQWQKNMGGAWNDISGATNYNYQIQANTANTGEYQCIVSEVNGLSITSNPVLLSLNTVPQIITQTSDQTVCEDNTVTFSVNASGDGLAYQWQNSIDGGNTWKNIAGITSADYNFTATSGLNGYFYRCLVNGSCGQQIISSTAQLTVNTKPQIAIQPANQAACEGDNITFSVGATGTGLSYQWQVNSSSTWTNVDGATNAMCNLTATSSMHGSQYRCVVSGVCGTVISNPALLTIGVQITKQPLDQTVCNGTIVNFGNVEAIGKAPFTYQWQIKTGPNDSWNDIPLATESNYATTASTSMNGQQFRCIVTGSCGYAATSSIAQLNLRPETQIITQPLDQADCEGNVINFITNATGFGITYQWEQSNDGMNTWAAVSGATSSTLQFTPVFAMNNYNYRCKVKGSCDAAWSTSGIAKLTVYKNTISPLAATVTPTTCEYGTNDGAITINTVTSDYLPLTYVWNNGASTPSISSLEAGNYKLVVTDSRNCKATIGRYVGPEAPILSNIKVTDIAIPGSSTGAIDPGISGGHNPLTYAWSNQAITDIITGLQAGTYKLTVTDSKQCAKVFSAEVKESDPVTYLTKDQLPTYDDRILDNSLPFGTISGNGNVSSTGAATYDIPISVVPGIAGMEPKVSIAYNSQSGNGLMGWGWNFKGTSAITRVTQDIYHDGKAKGIEINANDKYALDGNRLLVASGETYGADGAQYNTEIETFSTITSHGTYGDNGPEWFEVKTKNGTIYRYGSESGKLLYSHTATTGGRGGETVTKNAVLIWYLDYVEDIQGNFITYTYEQNGLNTYLKKISYGCNKNNNTGKYNTIDITYAKRIDPIPVHYGGENGKIDIIISKICTKSPNAIYRNYSFDYTSDNFSRLIKITESTGDGQSFNPTIIKWGQNNSETIVAKDVAVVNNWPANIPDYLKYDLKVQNLSSQDVNGDGKSDLVGFFNRNYDTYATTYLNATSLNGQCKFESGSLNNMPGGYPDYVYFDRKTGADNMGDINADNKTEIIAPEWDHWASPSEIYFYIYNKADKKEWNGASYYIYAKLNTSSEIPLYTTADINNDGYDEIIYIEKKATADHIYPGKIFTQRGWVDLNICYSNVAPDQIIAADFDGDGLKDLMIIDSNGFNIHKNQGGDESQSFAAPDINAAFGWDGTFNSSDNIKMGDFNGDGLPDFIFTKKGDDAGKWYLALNNGAMGFNVTLMPNITARDDKDTDKDDDKDNIIVTDFNNDGKADVIICDATYDKWGHAWGTSWKEFTGFYVYWYKSTGNGFELVKSTVSYNEEDAYNKHFVVGDFNGDGHTELINYGFDCYNGLDKEPKFRMYACPDNNESNVVVAITNGLNLSTDFSYKPITDNDVYTKTSTPAYPLSAVQLPINVVSELKTDDGLGGQNTISYKYEDAIMNKQGKGFLGFAKTIITNSNTNTTITTQSQYETKYFMLSAQTIETKVNDNLVSQLVNKYTIIPYEGVHIFPYLSSSEVSDVLKGNKAITQYLYNKDGNMAQQDAAYVCNEVPASSAMFPYFYETEKQYSNFDSYGNPGNINYWFLRGSDQFFFQRQSLVYNLNGKLENSTLNGVTTSYAYDAYGNLFTVTSSATGEEDRTDTIVYDPSGISVVKKSNALGYASKFAYDDAGFGLVKSTKDANGLETTFDYDSWGMSVKKFMPDKKVINNSIHWADSNDPNVPVNACYYTAASVTEGEKENFGGTEYFDKLGRSLRKVMVGFNGAQYYVDTKYNNKGQVEEVTEPYPAGEDPTKQTSYVYDDYGRVQTQTLPTGVSLTFAYDGNKTTTTYSTGEVYSKTSDGTGQVINASDPGGSINYYYSALNQPVRIESPGSTINFTYDPLGRQKTVTDPNTGTFTYGYNAFGEQTSQTDPHQKVTRLDYDLLGRITTKTVDTVTTTYTYDSGDKAKGTVTSISNNAGASMSFAYSTDGLCRLTSRTRSKDGESMTYKYSYDDLGRVKTMTYPAGYAVNYAYNDYDDLIEMDDSINNKLIWKVDEVNAKGQLKYATYGNGIRSEYSYDDNDRLNRIYAPGVIDFNYQFNDKQQLEYRDEKYWKDNYWQGFKESFTYDKVNRLETSAIDGVEKMKMTYNTAANDRISNKSDIGDYIYQANNHRLDKVDAMEGYLPPHQLLTYTAEGMVAAIKETNNDKVAKLLTLDYGVDNERFKTEFTQDTTRMYTRYYFDSFEKEIKADGTVRNLNYIYAGGSMVAIYEQKSTGDAMHYVYTDYLSSLRCITDGAGIVEQRLGFDAWGNRRNAFTGEKLTDIELAEVTSITSRGFTGHEHLDELGLINMNGRIYDPALGMFISPDVDIQAPDFTQNYNRYAYCLNNPLMYFDPTGNNFMDWLSDNWKPLVVAWVAISTTLVTSGLTSPYWADELFITSFSAAVGGFSAGITGAALNGESLNNTLSAGVYGFDAAGTLSLLSAGLFGLAGKAPLAKNQAGDPVPLDRVISQNLQRQILKDIGPAASAASSFVAPVVNTHGMLSTSTSTALDNSYSGVTIRLNRTNYNGNFTFGNFTVSSPLTDQTLTGVTLEPEVGTDFGMASSFVEGSNKITWPGEYDVLPYTSSNPALPISYELQNVPGRSYVLLHNGAIRDHTHGCILMGVSGNSNLGTIHQSIYMMQQLRNFINTNKGLTRGIRIIIN